MVGAAVRLDSVSTQHGIRSAEGKKFRSSFLRSFQSDRYRD